MHHTLVVSFLLLLALVAAACGDDDASGSAAVPTDVPAADDAADDADDAASAAGEGTSDDATDDAAADDDSSSADEPADTADDGGTAEPTTEPEPTPTPEPEPIASSAGCGAPAGELGMSTQTIVTTDGLERSYRQYLPAAADGTTPLPLVLNFHGLTSSAEQQAQLSKLEALAETEGFIAIHPQGTTPDTLGVPFWNTAVGEPSTTDPTLNVDDVAFTVELLDQLEATQCVDISRVFSTGLSNGGYFSARLACDLSERIAAVVTVAGVVHPDDCAPSRSVPMVHIHGTADDVVPFDGGESSLTGEDGLLSDGEPDDGAAGDDGSDDTADAADSFFVPIPGEMAEWAETSACEIEPLVEEVSAEVERRVYPNCASGGEVVFYVVDGGGHSWPGSALMASVPDFVGYTTFDIDATALAWEWFQAHPLS